MREKSSLSFVTINNLRSSTEIKSDENQTDLNSISSEINNEASVFGNFNRVDLSFDNVSYTVHPSFFSKGKLFFL